MKIFVKTDKGLRNLGEGRIYSKNQLRLIEADTNGDESTITLTNNGEGPDAKAPASELVNDANKELNIVNAGGKKTQFQVAPTGVAGVTPNTSLTQNSTQSAPAVDVSKNDPRLATLIQKNAQNGYATNIVKGTVNSSVASRKVMDEMRNNSIPFTKKELNKFLREL
jgi:hypothetical protein